MRNTHHLTVGITVFVLAIVSGGAPALAITNGPLDGNNHPSVGFIFGQQSDPNTCNAEVAGGCTATLISPTVAVSSGACADIFGHPEEYGYSLTAVWISFNGYDPFDCSAASRVDSIHAHPSFDETQLDSPTNFGVFVLTTPATVTPATLPAANSRGGYVNGDSFEVVNWGTEADMNIFSNRRRFAPATFLTSDADSLKLHLTLNGGEICLENVDGGGAFLPASQNLTALIRVEIGNCKVADYLRLDTPAVRDFLDDFAVTLP